MSATESTLLLPQGHTSRAPAVAKAIGRLGRMARRKPLGAAGGAILLLVVVVGIFSPWLARDELYEVHLSDALQGPSATYWFGTDESGRDLYSRVVYGAQVTAMVGLGTALVVAVVALVVGLISGYFGSVTDVTVQRLVDVWMSFPPVFLTLTLVAILGTTSSEGFLGLGRGPAWGPDPNGGPWFWNTFPRTTIVILVLGIVLAGGASRLVRSAVLTVKAQAYIEAAEASGAGHLRIMLRHVLPNILPTVIVLATLMLATAILAEATLSYLGVGVTNFPTWGQMLSGRTRELAENHLQLALVPGIAIFLAVFGFNMLGDALRDLLDPRLRGMS